MRLPIRPLALVAAVLSMLVLASCFGGGKSEKKTGSATGPAGRSGKRATGARLVELATFDTPTYITGPPGGGRLFVIERKGVIQVLHGRQKLSRPFLDLSKQVSLGGGERGMFSMEFSPDYVRSGRFYVYFTAKDGDVRITEFNRSSKNPDVADPASARDVLRLKHREHPNHNGGTVVFGPDGKMYIGPGDGGGANDPHRNGQSLGTMLGKLLRIEPRPNGGYDVPRDNPFVGRAGARPEIWAYGLRNPYRFSFDRLTGDLVIGDVGQNDWEEVDFAKRGEARGKNYGWSPYEGFKKFHAANPPDFGPRPENGPCCEQPVIAMSHKTGNCAVIGGYVVRDPALTTLYGRYLFGDLCNPVIYETKLTGTGRAKYGDSGLRVRSTGSFGQDAAGHVYVTSLSGPVYELAPTYGR
jgi:glucose/arabinose dehydrogenase